MPIFYIPGDCSGKKTLFINGDDASHITRSLRMKPGEALSVNDGAGNTYTCRITSGNAGSVELAVIGEHKNRAEPSAKISLFQGVPKSDKMDFIVQKAVELGVGSITPVYTAHTVARYDPSREASRLARWRRIADEAAKQCGRAPLVEIHSFMNFTEALAALSRFPSSFLCYEGETPVSLSGFLRNNPLSETGFIIGPEGGFSDSEAAAAKEAGIPSVTLGTRILRTETAAMYVLAVYMYISGGAL